jgi:hypothetical protein
MYRSSILSILAGSASGGLGPSAAAGVCSPPSRRWEVIEGRAKAAESPASDEIELRELIVWRREGFMVANGSIGFGNPEFGKPARRLAVALGLLNGLA